jgi:hypothetical protein
MKKYRVEAGQTQFFTYAIEVEASSKKEAEKKALDTPLDQWHEEYSENFDGLGIDIVEEV